MDRLDDEDLVLRAPLPISIRSNPSGCSNDDSHNNNKEKNEENVYPSSMPSPAMISAILVAGQVLELREETIFTAGCLLYRFYFNFHDDDNNYGVNRNNKNSNNNPHYRSKPWVGDDSNTKMQKSKNGDDEFVDEETRLILVCCILLATKTQEDHRRLRDFINLSHMLSWKKNGETRNKNDINNQQQKEQHQQQQQQRHYGSTLYWKEDPPPLDEGYWATKERIVAMEQHVLRWLAFDTHVAAVHRAVVALVIKQQQQHSLKRQGNNHENDHIPLVVVDKALILLNRVGLYAPQALTVPVMDLATAALLLATGDYTHQLEPNYNRKFVVKDEIFSMNGGIQQYNVDVAKRAMQQVLRKGKDSII